MRFDTVSSANLGLFGLAAGIAACVFILVLALATAHAGRAAIALARTWATGLRAGFARHLGALAGAGVFEVFGVDRRPALRAA